MFSFCLFLRLVVFLSVLLLLLLPPALVRAATVVVDLSGDDSFEGGRYWWPETYISGGATFDRTGATAYVLENVNTFVFHLDSGVHTVPLTIRRSTIAVINISKGIIGTSFTVEDCPQLGRFDFTFPCDHRFFSPPHAGCQNNEIKDAKVTIRNNKFLSGGKNFMAYSKSQKKDDAGYAMLPMHVNITDSELQLEGNSFVDEKESKNDDRARPVTAFLSFGNKLDVAKNTSRNIGWGAHPRVVHNSIINSKILVEKNSFRTFRFGGNVIKFAVAHIHSRNVAKIDNVEYRVRHNNIVQNQVWTTKAILLDIDYFAGHLEISRNTIVYSVHSANEKTDDGSCNAISLVYYANLVDYPHAMHYFDLCSFNIENNHISFFRDWTATPDAHTHPCFYAYGVDIDVPIRMRSGVSFSSSEGGALVVRGNHITHRGNFSAMKTRGVGISLPVVYGTPKSFILDDNFFLSRELSSEDANGLKLNVVGFGADARASMRLISIRNNTFLMGGNEDVVPADSTRFRYRLPYVHAITLQTRDQVHRRGLCFTNSTDGKESSTPFEHCTEFGRMGLIVPYAEVLMEKNRVVGTRGICGGVSGGLTINTLNHSARVLRVANNFIDMHCFVQEKDHSDSGMSGGLTPLALKVLGISVGNDTVLEISRNNIRFLLELEDSAFIKNILDSKVFLFCAVYVVVVGARDKSQIPLHLPGEVMRGGGFEVSKNKLETSMTGRVVGGPGSAFATLACVFVQFGGQVEDATISMTDNSCALRGHSKCPFFGCGGYTVAVSGPERRLRQVTISRNELTGSTPPPQMGTKGKGVFMSDANFLVAGVALAPTSVADMRFFSISSDPKHPVFAVKKGFSLGISGAVEVENNKATGSSNAPMTLFGLSAAGRLSCRVLRLAGNDVRTLSAAAAGASAGPGAIDPAAVDPFVARGLIAIDFTRETHPPSRLFPVSARDSNPVFESFLNFLKQAESATILAEEVHFSLGAIIVTKNTLRVAAPGGGIVLRNPIASKLQHVELELGIAAAETAAASSSSSSSCLDNPASLTADNAAPGLHIVGNDIEITEVSPLRGTDPLTPSAAFISFSNAHRFLFGRDAVVCISSASPQAAGRQRIAFLRDVQQEGAEETEFQKKRAGVFFSFYLAPTAQHSTTSFFNPRLFVLRNTDMIVTACGSEAPFCGFTEPMAPPSLAQQQQQQQKQQHFYRRLVADELPDPTWSAPWPSRSFSFDSCSFTGAGCSPTAAPLVSLWWLDFWNRGDDDDEKQQQQKNFVTFHNGGGGTSSIALVAGKNKRSTDELLTTFILVPRSTVVVLKGVHFNNSNRFGRSGGRETVVVRIDDGSNAVNSGTTTTVPGADSPVEQQRNFVNASGIEINVWGVKLSEGAGVAYRNLEENARFVMWGGDKEDGTNSGRPPPSARSMPTVSLECLAVNNDQVCRSSPFFKSLTKGQEDRVHLRKNDLLFGEARRFFFRNCSTSAVPGLCGAGSGFVPSRTATPPFDPDAVDESEYLLPGALPEATKEAIDASSAVLSAIASVGAPGAAVASMRMLELPIGCAARAPSGKRWEDETLAFPSTLLPGVAIGEEKGGGHMRAAIVGFLVALLVVGPVLGCAVAAAMHFLVNRKKDEKGENRQDGGFDVGDVAFWVSRVMRLLLAQFAVPLGKACGLLALAQKTRDATTGRVNGSFAAPGDVVLVTFSFLFYFGATGGIAFLILFVAVRFPVPKKGKAPRQHADRKKKSEEKQQQQQQQQQQRLAEKEEAAKAKAEAAKPLSLVLNDVVFQDCDAPPSSGSYKSKLRIFVSGPWGARLVTGRTMWLDKAVQKANDDEDDDDYDDQQEDGENINRQTETARPARATSFQKVLSRFAFPFVMRTVGPVISSSLQHQEAERASPKKTWLRSRLGPISLLLLVFLGFVVGFLMGLAAAENQLCPHMLRFISFWNVVAALFQIACFPLHVVPVRSAVETAMDIVTSVFSIIAAASLSSPEAVASVPGVMEFVVHFVPVAMYAGLVCIVFFFNFSLGVKMCTNAILVPVYDEDQVVAESAAAAAERHRRRSRHAASSSSLSHHHHHHHQQQQQHHRHHSSSSPRRSNHREDDFGDRFRSSAGSRKYHDRDDRDYSYYSDPNSRSRPRYDDDDDYYEDPLLRPHHHQPHRGSSGGRRNHHQSRGSNDRHQNYNNYSSREEGGGGGNGGGSRGSGGRRRTNLQDLLLDDAAEELTLIAAQRPTATRGRAETPRHSHSRSHRDDHHDRHQRRGHDQAADDQEYRSPRSRHSQHRQSPNISSSSSRRKLQDEFSYADL